ncbi:MAG: hypothetical protein AAB038_00375 [Planctomycetota bacterium]
MKNRWLITVLSGIIVATGVLGLSATPEGTSNEKEKDQPKKEDIKKIVTDAFTKISSSKGYHFKGERKTTSMMGRGMGAPNIPTSLEGLTMNHYKSDVISDTTLTYMTFETKMMSSSQKNALYQQGKKRYCLNLADGKQIDNPTQTPAAQIEMLKDSLSDFTLIKDAKPDDSNCFVVTATIGAKGADFIMDSIPKMMMLSTMDIKRSYTQSTLAIWIDKDTNLPRKISYLLEATSEISMGQSEGKMKGPNQQILQEVSFYDYGKDIEIELPPEVKEFLESKS